MGFQEDVKALCDTIRHMHDCAQPAEIISDEDAATALIILNLLAYHTVADVFLGCASINLINTYVKQAHNRLNYQFKRHILNLLKGIEDAGRPEEIRIGYDSGSGEAILIIDICSFQFSYKAVRFSSQVNRLLGGRNIEWDGLKKQPYSKTIFGFSFRNPYLSNRTTGESVLKEKVASELNLFRQGSYRFEDGKLLKVKGFSTRTEAMDDSLKNYYRVKLSKCRNRPVVLSGVFVKAWGKHVTFRDIKPYIESVKAVAICDHINILREDLEKDIEIDSLQVGMRYYIIGNIYYYWDNRIGFRLASGYGFVPLFNMFEFQKMSKDVMSVCYRFSIEEYINALQGKLKM